MCVCVCVYCYLIITPKCLLVSKNNNTFVTLLKLIINTNPNNL